MKRARLTIITLVSLTALALLAACGGTETEPPLGSHVLLNPHTGTVLATFDRDSQSYNVEHIDLTWLIRNILEGRVQVEHQPEGLADKVDRPGEATGAALKPYVLDCRGGATACNSECVDLRTDRDNCGTCGLTCEGSCMDGACYPRM